MFVVSKRLILKQFKTCITSKQSNSTIEDSNIDLSSSLSAETSVRSAWRLGKWGYISAPPKQKRPQMMVRMKDFGMAYPLCKGGVQPWKMLMQPILIWTLQHLSLVFTMAMEVKQFQSSVPSIFTDRCSSMNHTSLEIWELLCRRPFSEWMR
ncbi:unnamed protein product [Citrullus colocynthis]|uniref:Uncharacterized protein n=1 Tax=Citrullus colocynthis TaxID=252529 RepID=A0ABP0XRL3_9ROSI